MESQYNRRAIRNQPDNALQENEAIGNHGSKLNRAVAVSMRGHWKHGGTESTESTAEPIQLPTQSPPSVTQMSLCFKNRATDPTTPARTLETRRHRVHGVRSLKSNASFPSVTYSLSPTSRRSAVALAVPLTGIGAEQLRPERRRTVFRPFFSALTKIKEVDPGRHELQ